MRFMMLLKADKNTEAGVLPTEQELATMGQYNQQLIDAGVLLDGQGLQPSSKGARVTFPGGKPKVTDGPFVETKELIAGYWMVNAKSKEDAIEWAKKVPFQMLPTNQGTPEIEIRQVFELEDFPNVPPEVAEMEKKFATNQGVNKSGAVQIKEIAPYLMFNGNCAEAFRFYQSVLGGKLDIQTYGNSPAKEHVPAEAHGKVIHARLSLGNWALMGSDDASPGAFEKPQGTQVTLTLATEVDAKRVFDALAQSGKQTMPFGKTFWSSGFGMLVDRFGTPWMVNTYAPAA